MADNKQDNIQPPKNEHGESFPDRPAGEKSRYDPEFEMPDPDAVEKDVEESEKEYKDRKAS